MQVLDNYIENINNTMSAVWFYAFITTITVLTIILIISLLCLIIGCLIKSQKIKSNFLKAAIYILLILGFILVIPYIIVAFKSFI